MSLFGVTISSFDKYITCNKENNVKRFACFPVQLCDLGRGSWGLFPIGLTLPNSTEVQIIIFLHLGTDESVHFNQDKPYLSTAQPHI